MENPLYTFTLSPEEEKESEQRGGKERASVKKREWAEETVGDFFLSQEDVLNELRKNSDTPTDIKTQAG